MLSRFRIGFLLMVSLLGLTCGSAAIAEIKLAVVDVQRAILASEEAQGYMRQIQEEFAEEEQEIRDLQTDAAAILERLRTDGEVMTESEKRRLQQDIESKNNDFVYLQQKLQRQIQERQKELFSGMDSKLQESIRELVIADDYDVILPRQAMLYVGDIFDITGKVTERLNQMKDKD